MENIEKLKKHYIEVFSKKYFNKSSLELSEDLLNRCTVLGEIWAYIMTVLPTNEKEDISKYTIFDFDGCLIKDNKEIEAVIPHEIALNAKNLICEYCWGIFWSELKSSYKSDKKIKEFMRNNSVMKNRIRNGNNLVIFGASDKPIGKTMISSIIMKEAIKLRMNARYRGNSYDWIEFSTLKHEILKDSLEMAEYRSCDWLVIDNILQPEYASIQQKAYISEMMDSFFIDRLKNNLPTILVFKFDIRNRSFNMEKEMGIGISKMVYSNKTYMIPLCEEIEII